MRKLTLALVLGLSLGFANAATGSLDSVTGSVGAGVTASVNGVNGLILASIEQFFAVSQSIVSAAGGLVTDLITSPSK